MYKKTWKHLPNKIPQFDYDDLLTIVYLVENYGNENIPIFSKQIMKKVNESMGAYKAEKDLLEKAKNSNNFKSIVTWPKNTEYLGKGPFFNKSEDFPRLDLKFKK